MITIDDWKKAGDFGKLVKSKQYPLEVSEQVYTDMLEVLPPQEFQARHWGNYKPRKSLKQYDEYFLVGEATAHVKDKPVYASFGYITKNKKHYFIGYLHSINPEQ